MIQILRIKLIGLTVLLLSGVLHSQSNTVILEQYITEHLNQLGVTANDVQSLKVNSEQFSVPSGLTHIYFNQTLHCSSFCLA